MRFCYIDYTVGKRTHLVDTVRWSKPLVLAQKRNSLHSYNSFKLCWWLVKQIVSIRFALQINILVVILGSVHFTTAHHSEGNCICSHNNQMTSPAWSHSDPRISGMLQLLCTLTQHLHIRFFFKSEFFCQIPKKPLVLAQKRNSLQSYH